MFFICPGPQKQRRVQLKFFHYNQHRCNKSTVEQTMYA